MGETQSHFVEVKKPEYRRVAKSTYRISIHRKFETGEIIIL